MYVCIHCEQLVLAGKSKGLVTPPWFAIIDKSGQARLDTETTSKTQCVPKMSMTGRFFTSPVPRHQIDFHW